MAVREPWEWTEADLDLLIRNQIQESLTLDYKACAALTRTDASKKEVSKDVSALANSAGGTIVYGMIEEGYLPTKIDEGFGPAGPITREWLEQVIGSNISPKIDGVRIAAIPIPVSRPGAVVYIVSVPQSLRAPHMARDHRYYKRHNLESQPMEDYEVKDVARRLDAPLLDVKIELLPSGAPPRMISSSSEPFELKVSLSNDSVVPAHHAVLSLFLKRSIRIHDLGRFVLDEKQNAGEGETGITFLYGATAAEFPLWRGFAIAPRPYLTVSVTEPRAAAPVRYFAHCPHTEAVTGHVLIVNDGYDVATIRPSEMEDYIARLERRRSRS